MARHTSAAGASSTSFLDFSLLGETMPKMRADSRRASLVGSFTFFSLGAASFAGSSNLTASAVAAGAAGVSSAAAGVSTAAGASAVTVGALSQACSDAEWRMWHSLVSGSGALVASSATAGVASASGATSAAGSPPAIAGTRYGGERVGISSAYCSERRRRHSRRRQPRCARQSSQRRAPQVQQVPPRHWQRLGRSPRGQEPQQGSPQPVRGVNNCPSRRGPP